MDNKFLKDLHDTRDYMHEASKHLRQIANCLAATGNNVLARNIDVFAIVIKKDIDALVESYRQSLGISKETSNGQS